MIKWIISVAVAAVIVVLVVVFVFLENPADEEISFEHCGPVLTCSDFMPYRTMDGSCNNLKHPHWGMAKSKFARLMPARYGNGIHSPTLSLSGQPLPSERTLSYTLYGNDNITDPNFTLANMQWGQFVAHDLSRVFVLHKTPSELKPCCPESGQPTFNDETRTFCNPIIIPPDDPDFSAADFRCFPFIRTFTDRDLKCNYKGGPAEQILAPTSFLDLSLVYGNSLKQTRELRMLSGGRMSVEERNGRQWLPSISAALKDFLKLCFLPNETCFLSADDRANQNPGLVILHIMLVTEHNRLADALAKLNPLWDDDTLFEEARKINIAQFQYITYYEWLPNFLGIEHMIEHRLIYTVLPSEFVNDYDPNVNPTTLNEHTAAAFRSFHAQIAGKLDLFSEMRNVTDSLRLSEWIKRPAIVEVNDNFDSLTRGLATQPSALTDTNYDPAISKCLFETNPDASRDLHAHDIHRGRDHGIASYNDMRGFCGLKKAVEWRDFEDMIDPQVVQKLQSLYESPDDVDLIIGGSLESHAKDALAGPTFLCILTEQFFRTRVGDRYFFENSNSVTGLKPGQLREIRKASVARLLCDNSHIKTIQPRAFLAISDSNDLVPCARIPELNLSEWIETNVQESPKCLMGKARGDFINCTYT